MLMSKRLKDKWLNFLSDYQKILENEGVTNDRNSNERSSSVTPSESKSFFSQKSILSFEPTSSMDESQGYLFKKKKLN